MSVIRSDKNNRTQSTVKGNKGRSAIDHDNPIKANTHSPT
jgi:hypothetical protein